jgi:hypothetical protein
MHFHPQNRPYLRVLGFNLNVNPNPTLQSARLDPENNIYHQVWMNEAVMSLEIHADIILEVSPFNPFDFIVDINGPHSSKDYLQHNQYYLRPYLEEGELPEQMIHFVKKSWNEDPVAHCFNLAREVKQDWTHETRPEHGILTPRKCFERRAGSCRDLTRMTIAMLRSQGFPCRHVSGYCFVPELEDGHELHAWLEVYLPGSGWLGVDPSLGLLTSENHIPVAASFEPSRTMSIQGFYHGSASSSMEAAIKINTES